MGKMLRLRQSKIFISFLIALVLVFSFEQSKPKAIAPLVGWGAAMLGGMIIEEAAEMGIKWGSKAIAKKKGDEWAAALWKNGEEFDFAKTNPYRNKDGSVYVNPSVNDRAKIASFLAGTLGGLAIEDAINGDYEIPPSYPNGKSSVFYHQPTNSRVNILSTGGIGNNCALETIMDNVSEVYYEIDTADARDMHFILYNKFGSWFVNHGNMDHNRDYNIYSAYDSTTLVPSLDSFYTNQSTYANKVMSEQMKVCMFGEKIYTDGEITVTNTINNVYTYPNHTVPEGYVPPNAPNLENRPYIIPNVFAPGDFEGEIQWGDIENNFDNSEEVISIMDIAADQYAANGDINNTTYTSTVINNYYTDIGQDKTKEEVEQETEALVPEVPPEGDGGELVPVDPIDRSMLAVITESYSYLADSIDTSLVAMRKVTDGATGIVDFLDQSFRWLPAEWRAMFGAAFILGVFAHFFRR